MPHSRPVINGAPVKEWKLECAPCEKFLRADMAASGYRKQRTVNEDAGMKLAERYVGLWGTTPDTVPETPDEEKKREHDEAAMVTKNAARQTQAMDEISDAVKGNADLLGKFLDLQIALARQNQGAAPLPVLVPGHDIVTGEVNPYTAEVRQCQDCGTDIVRSPGQKGALPWRCPDCKAKKTAARRKVA